MQQSKIPSNLSITQGISSLELNMGFFDDNNEIVLVMKNKNDTKYLHWRNHFNIKLKSKIVKMLMQIFNMKCMYYNLKWKRLTRKIKSKNNYKIQRKQIRTCESRVKHWFYKTLQLWLGITITRWMKKAVWEDQCWNFYWVFADKEIASFRKHI